MKFLRITLFLIGILSITALNAVSYKLYPVKIGTIKNNTNKTLNVFINGNLLKTISPGNTAKLNQKLSFYEQLGAGRSMLFIPHEDIRVESEDGTMKAEVAINMQSFTSPEVDIISELRIKQFTPAGLPNVPAGMLSADFSAGYLDETIYREEAQPQGIEIILDYIFNESLKNSIIKLRKYYPVSKHTAPEA